MANKAFSTWPEYGQDQIDAVVRVLRSGKVNYWTGEEGRLFENEFAAAIGCGHAVALTNGTAALEVALRALGIGARDEVVVTPRTFVASASCIATIGAIPRFADVDSDSQNVTAESIDAALTPKTRAVICVHLAGWPCEMDAIMTLTEERRLSVVEDCAQAHGARYRGLSVGAIGNIGAWSFCQDKIMTTGGEGGMTTTSDGELRSRMWSYKDHGKAWGAVYEREHPPGFRWLHESFGTNFRMLEAQAAIGRIQLEYLDDWHQRRTQNANQLLNGLSDIEALRVPRPPSHVEHAWYKFHAFIRPDLLKTNWDRDRILDEAGAAGIPCFAGSCSEVYLERAFANTGWRPAERLPVARALGETSLMVLVDPTVSSARIDKTIEVLKAVMARAVR